MFIFFKEYGFISKVKVDGAEAAGLYDLKMENAAIIRKAARDLMVQQHSLDMFGFEYVEYYQMVRDLIEEYRLLFIDWVAVFDKWAHLTKIPMMTYRFMDLRKIRKSEYQSLFFFTFFSHYQVSAS